MKGKIFSECGEKYLRDEMNICLKELNNKLLSDAPDHLIFFKDLIDFMIELKSRPHNYEIGNLYDSKYHDYLDGELTDFSEQCHLQMDSCEYFIFDSIRHAFVIFNEFGLYDLYKHREAESWYPKIVIRKKIGIEADICSLGNEMIIYRGTSKKEYTSKSFSQSWTLNKDIAHKFAFGYYSEQPDYKNTERVIIETTIDNKSIYYYNKDDNEEEVVIDEKKIQICKTKIVS